MGVTVHFPVTEACRTKPQSCLIMNKLVFCSLACLFAMAVAEHHIRDLAGQINNEILKRAADNAKRAVSAEKFEREVRELTDNVVKRAESVLRARRSCNQGAVMGCLGGLGQPGNDMGAMCAMMNKQLACFSPCSDAELDNLGALPTKTQIASTIAQLRC